MNSRHSLFVTSLVLLIVIAACGGGGFNENNLTVTVSPAAATVAESGQVTLQATIHGNCPGCTTLLFWSIAEADGSQCNWNTTPPPGPCPDGTLQGVAGGNSGTATYHAPSTSGTFHVIAEWDEFCSIGDQSKFD